jgi:hypothetical protein
MRVRTTLVLLALVLAGTGGSVVSQGRNASAPESFTANLQAQGAEGGAAAATITIDIKRYTPPADLTSVEDALKHGGHAGFVAALRKAPEVGAVSFSSKTWPIRWARERAVGDNTRKIVIVTDQPMHFVGGGSTEAKARTGFDVAVIELEVDNVGLGRGSMAAAAKVKPDGQGGVVIDDYAEKPIKLVTVVRKLQ